MHKSLMGAKVYKPRIKISFHTETKCYQAETSEANQYGETLDPLDNVLSVSTQKNLSNPAGAFTVSLAGHQWSSRLKPNDIVVIQMGYVGEKTTSVMVGLIDTISRTRSIGSDGKPTVSCSITGRDFGKVLLKTVLKFYPEIGAKDEKIREKLFLTDTGWINMMKFFVGDDIVIGTPAEILDRIMRYILIKLNDVNWKVYDEAGKTPVQKNAKLANIVRYNFAKVDFFLPFILNADQFEGSIWNLMERTNIKPFTEMFIDVRSDDEAWRPTPDGRVVPDTIQESSSQAKNDNFKEGEGKYHSPASQFGEDKAKVILVYRQTPFDDKHWKRLRRWRIEPEDVLNEELSISDNEHFNLFWAGTLINPLDIDLKKTNPPLINEKDIKRYGISPLEVDIDGLDIREDERTKGIKSLDSMTKEHTARLKAWFENNHTYWSGALTIRGRAEIRIGHRVLYNDQVRDLEYYVEAVNHSYNVFTDWTTTLTITRGKRPSETIDSSKYVPKPPEPKKEAVIGATAKNEGTYHTVVRGDTLWALAGRYYSNNNQWRKIWDANRDMLIARDKRNATRHGHWIYPGQKLRIPPK